MIWLRPQGCGSSLVIRPEILNDACFHPSHKQCYFTTVLSKTGLGKRGISLATCTSNISLWIQLQSGTSEGKLVVDSKQQTTANKYMMKWQDIENLQTASHTSVHSRDLCLNLLLETSKFHCVDFSLSESVSWQRNLSFSCVETHTFPVFFNATSFLQLPGRANHDTISVSFQFRTWNPDGLLLFSNLDDGTLEISLEDSKAAVHINVTMGTRNNRVDLSSGKIAKVYN